MTRLIRGVVAVAAAKKFEWVRERESIKGSFYRDWDKMQQILKAGYSKPVSLAMNEDIKVGKCDLFLLVITNCFSLSLKCIKGTQKVTTFLHLVVQYYLNGSPCSFANTFDFDVSPTV